MTLLTVTATLSAAGLTVTFSPRPAVPASGTGDEHPADDNPSVKVSNG